MRSFQILYTCLFCLIVISSFQGKANAGPHLVFDINTGQVYSQSGAFDRWYPASLTKMMTAYVVLSEIKKGRIGFRSPVIISANALSKPPTKMGFPVGTVLTVETALKIILVKSSNDVATAIAESVGGSEANFARMMNRYAKKISMTASHFVNPHGLHSVAQYVSAHDLGILARQIYREFPEQANLFSIQAIKIGKRVLKNHNALLRRFPGTIGMKTGFVCAAGLNITVSAKIQGDIIVAIVLGEESGKARNVKAARLLTNVAKRNQDIPFVHFDEMKPLFTPLQPLDMTDQVCRKKNRKKPQPNLMFEDLAIEYFPVKGQTLKEQEALYLTDKPIDYQPMPIQLGGAGLPDPYGLLRPVMAEDKKGKFDASGERFVLESGQVIPIPVKRPKS